MPLHSPSALRSLVANRNLYYRSLFTDKQLIKLQETPDEVPEGKASSPCFFFILISRFEMGERCTVLSFCAVLASAPCAADLLLQHTPLAPDLTVPLHYHASSGETPYTVSLFTFDDLVDTVRPGDRLEVTGIFRALPRRLNSHMTTMRSIYKTYVDAVHFKCVAGLSLHGCARFASACCRVGKTLFLRSHCAGNRTRATKPPMSRQASRTICTTVSNPTKKCNFLNLASLSLR